MDVNERPFIPAHSLADTITRGGQLRVRKSQHLTSLEVAALEAYVRYHILNADQLAALIGTSHRFACYIIKNLKSESNRYIKLCEGQQIEPPPYTRPLYYRLDKNGVKEIKARGFKNPKWAEVHRYIHKAQETNIDLSIELGERAHPEVRITRMPEILAHPRTPEIVRKSRYPRSIPLTRFLPSGNRAHYHMDGRFTVIEPPSQRRFFFPGWEAETGDNTAQVVEETKFRDIIDILYHEIYLDYLGAANIYFPFFFPHTTRMDELIKRWTRVTEPHHEFRPRILFAVEPTIVSGKPVADGHVLEQPYLYVGENGKIETLSLID